MSSVHAVIAAIQDKMGALPGIKAAPDYVPENESPFPFIIAYEGPGIWKIGSPGCMQSMATIKIELHVARKDMPRDVAQAVFYSDKIPNAIFDGFNDDLLGNTVDAIGEIETSGLVFLQFFTPNGIGDHIGYIFTLKDVKIITTIT